MSGASRGPHAGRLLPATSYSIFDESLILYRAFWPDGPILRISVYAGVGSASNSSSSNDSNSRFHFLVTSGTGAVSGPYLSPFFFLPLVASTSGRRGSSAWQLPVGSIDQALSRGGGDRREGNLVLSRSFLVFGYTLILRTLEEFGAPQLLFQI